MTSFAELYADRSQCTARVIYSELPDPLTLGNLHRLFIPSFDERKWASAVACTPTSQVGWLLQLKVFLDYQAISSRLGYCLREPASTHAPGNPRFPNLGGDHFGRILLHHSHSRTVIYGGAYLDRLFAALPEAKGRVRAPSSRAPN